MSATGAPRLEVRKVSKRFGSTAALREVSLSVAAGEVHGLLGENGAGKSTLMKILSGAHDKDSGEILLDGRPVALSSPVDSRRAGIAMIYQELNLAPHLTVAENISLGRESHCCGWIRKRERDKRAAAALESLHCSSIRLTETVAHLTMAQQQMVEIARALLLEPRVLIMDEPTSSLTQHDTVNLFNVIRKLRDRGVSVVYISHFLEECQDLCDRYTVLRDGEAVARGEMGETSLPGIIRAMVGREVEEIYAVPEHRIGQAVLQLRDVSGRTLPRGVSLQLREGEIFGLFGLVGAGRTETLRTVFGLNRLAGGEVKLTRSPDKSSHVRPHRRLAQGVGLLSEDRKSEGLLLRRSVADNLTLGAFRSVSTLCFLQEGRQRRAARRWIEELDIKAQGPGQLMEYLSGGNQQKVALGRLLHAESTILLLDEPTRGVDVGSKGQIYQLMGRLAEQGKAILFVSSYLPELLGVCDTLGVMSRGRLVDVRACREWTEEEVMACATGADDKHGREDDPSPFKQASA